MSNLVTCPKCGGTGQIKIPEVKAPEAKGTFSKFIDDNVAQFSSSYGFVSKKVSRPSYKTCPDCNGFGQVRG